MSRILLYEPIEQPVDPRSLLAGASGQNVVVCTDRESLLDAMGERRPDVLVYVLHDLGSDLGLLARLRRVAPSLPLILLGAPGDLASRISIQELKPTYFGVFPLEGSELSDAVRGVLRRVGNRA